MRLAIVNLTHGGLSGGYLKYLRAMVPRLAAHPRIERVDVLAPDQSRERLQDPAWLTDTFRVDPWYSGFRNLNEAVLARAPDVILIPTANWTDFGRVPSVVMVRNMEPLEVPFGGNPLREAMRNLARRAAARRACRRATRVIAVSRHVAGFLSAQWEIRADRLGVVYHGVDRAPEAVPPARPRQLPDGIGPFVFTAGSIRPARGLVDLVDALSELRTSGLPTTVVVAGAVDAGMDAFMRSLQMRATAGGVADRIVWTGPLSQAEMRWCYEASSAFVMTSRAEACPNVALEAMSHGCICVSVDHAPMPEFFGSSALYYRARDGKALAHALASLFSSPATHQSARRADAVSRALAFSWDTTAENTVAQLTLALRSPRG